MAKSKPKFQKKPEVPETKQASKTEAPLIRPKTEANNRSGFRDPLVLTCFGFLGAVIGYLCLSFVLPQFGQVNDLTTAMNSKVSAEQLRPLQEFMQKMVIEKTVDKANAANKSLWKVCQAISKDFAGKAPTATAVCKEIAATSEGLMAEYELPRKAGEQEPTALVQSATGSSEPEKEPRKKIFHKPTKKPRTPKSVDEDRVPAAN